MSEAATPRLEAERPPAKLIVLRGNSGSGKSIVASGLRAAYGRGLSIVRQDVVRRDILRERDWPNAVNIGLMDLMTRHLLDQGIPVVLEGIMATSRYGEMLAALARDHPQTVSYYFDIPFEITAERHRTKPNCHEWTVEAMREWFIPGDVLPGGADRIIGPDSTLEETVQRILTETGLMEAPRPPQASLADSEIKIAV
jgi:predicted kinase